MDYFSAPIWDDKKCPHTDSDAKPLDVEIVKRRRAIHVKNASYRNAKFSGTFLLSKSEALPLEKEGKRRVMVECCWFGHRLKDEEPTFLVDLANAVGHSSYDGAVTTNLGK